LLCHYALDAESVCIENLIFFHPVFHNTFLIMIITSRPKFAAVNLIYRLAAFSLLS